MRCAGSLAVLFVSCLLATSACQASETAKTSKQEGDVAITAIDGFIAEQKIDKSKSSWKTQLPKPPKVAFDASKTYYWNLDTNVGKIKVKLLPDAAPRQRLTIQPIVPAESPLLRMSEAEPSADR